LYTGLTVLPLTQKEQLLFQQANSTNKDNKLKQTNEDGTKFKKVSTTFCFGQNIEKWENSVFFFF